MRELQQREWAAVLRAPRPAAEPYDLAWPERGRLDADPGRVARAQGCLLGQLAGDALGSLVEYQGPEEIRRHYPDGVRLLEDGGHWDTIAGQPTDDGELALMLGAVNRRVGQVRRRDRGAGLRVLASLGSVRLREHDRAGARGHLRR